MGGARIGSAPISGRVEAGFRFWGAGEKWDRLRSEAFRVFFWGGDVKLSLRERGLGLWSRGM